MGRHLLSSWTIAHRKTLKARWMLPKREPGVNVTHVPNCITLLSAMNECNIAKRFPNCEEIQLVFYSKIYEDYNISSYENLCPSEDDCLFQHWDSRAMWPRLRRVLFDYAARKRRPDSITHYQAMANIQTMIPLFYVFRTNTHIIVP